LTLASWLCKLNLSAKHTEERTMSQYPWVHLNDAKYAVTEDTCYPEYGFDAEIPAETLPCWKITRWAGHSGTTFARFGVKAEAEAVCAVLNAFLPGELR
jgi:hypothetical protein